MSWDKIKKAISKSFEKIFSNQEREISQTSLSQLEQERLFLLRDIKSSGV